MEMYLISSLVVSVIYAVLINSRKFIILLSFFSLMLLGEPALIYFLLGCEGIEAVFYGAIFNIGLLAFGFLISLMYLNIDLKMKGDRGGTQNNYR